MFENKTLLSYRRNVDSFMLNHLQARHSSPLLFGQEGIVVNFGSGYSYCLDDSIIVKLPRENKKLREILVSYAFESYIFRLLLISYHIGFINYSKERFEETVCEVFKGAGLDINKDELFEYLEPFINDLNVSIDVSTLSLEQGKVGEFQGKFKELLLLTLKNEISEEYLDDEERHKRTVLASGFEKDFWELFKTVYEKNEDEEFEKELEAENVLEEQREELKTKIEDFELEKEDFEFDKQELELLKQELKKKEKELHEYESELKKQEKENEKFENELYERLNEVVKREKAIEKLDVKKKKD